MYEVSPSNLVIMKDKSTESVIQAIETLHNLRGGLIKIVLDAHKSHVSLLNDKHKEQCSMLIQ